MVTLLPKSVATGMPSVCFIVRRKQPPVVAALPDISVPEAPVVLACGMQMETSPGRHCMHWRTLAASGCMNEGRGSDMLPLPGGHRTEARGPPAHEH